MNDWFGDWRRIRVLINRRQFERDLDEEMRLHKELRQEEYETIGNDKDDARGAWKDQLQQQLCDRFGLTVTVAHYPAALFWIAAVAVLQRMGKRLGRRQLHF
jgi:hypothetical protein